MSSPADDRSRKRGWAHLVAAAANGMPPALGTQDSERTVTRQPDTSGFAPPEVARTEPAPRRWDLRLVLPVVLAWAGSLAGTTGVWGRAAVAITIVVVLVLCVALLIAWTRRSIVALMVASFALLFVAAGWSGMSALDEARAGPIGRAIDRGADITAVIEVKDDPRHSTAPARFGDPPLIVRGTIVEATAAGERFTSQTPVLILSDDRCDQCRNGSTIRLSGKLAASDLAGSRQIALLRASSGPTILSQPQGADAAAGWLRERLRTQSAQQSAVAGQLLPGLLLGDRTTLSGELDAQMKATSLTHLTAVSGANCTIVLTAVVAVCRLFTRSKWVIFPATVLALAAFVFLVGFDASVLRAALMGVLGAATVLTGRSRIGFSLLCLSATTLLLVDPWMAADMAFILSVCATSGLIILSPPIGDWIRVLAPRVPGTLARLLAIPIAAQLVCAPIIVLLQPVMTTWSVPANLIAGLVVAPLTLIGTAGIVLLAIWPPLATPALWCCARGAEFIAGVANWFALAPAATIPVPEGWPGAILMALVSVVILLSLFGSMRLKKRLATHPHKVTRVPASTPQAAPTTQGRWPWWMVVAILVVVALLLGLGAAVLTRDAGAEPSAQVVQCDVGQGDGLVIMTGAHEAMIVDAGPPGDAMKSCLDRLRIRTLSAVVITHQHDDHYGGLAEAAAGRDVRRVYLSAGTPKLAPGLDRALQTIDAPVEQLSAPAADNIGDVRWQVLWPLPNRRASNENNNSLVIRVDIANDGGGALSLLLTGDLEDDAASSLLRSIDPHLLEGLDAIKVAHHGARNGGTAINERVRPRLALISVGADNDYGHPAEPVLTELEELGAVVWRTDEDGAATLRESEERLKLAPAR